MSDHLTAEVRISGKTYLIERLDTFSQMHLTADASPILSSLAIAKKDRPKGMSDANFLKGVQLIIMSGGNIPPERRDRIWNTCLGSIRRQETAANQPILSAPSQMQFADIDIVAIPRLLYAVFEHNRLLDFFSESLSVSDGQKETADNGPVSRVAKTG